MYDGDTLTLDIDLGLNTWVHGEKIRLAGINAPEVRGASRDKGLESRNFLRSLLPNGTQVEVITEKDKRGKYGRYIGRIMLNGRDLNNELVQAGHAVPYTD